MTHIIATFAAILVILCLFYLDRDAGVRSSPALWIPTIWMLIVASRSVSAWINPNSGASLAEQYSDSSPIDAAVFGLLILAGLLALNFRAQRVRSFLRVNTPLLLFFGYCALSVCWSDEPVVSLKRWVKSVGDFIMVMIVLTDLNPQAATKRLFTRIAYILLPLSVLLIGFYPEIGTAYNASEHMMLYVGVTTFKNLLGLTCMVCGLGSLWCFIRTCIDRTLPYRSRHLIAHGTMILTAVGLIVRADSMTSLSCLVLGGAVMILCAQRRIARRPAYLHSLIALCILLPFSALFVSTMGSLVHTLGRNSTLTGRTSIWAAVLAVHINPVVGAGFESFWLGSRLQEVWDRSIQGIQEAHDGYLELYLNLGWIGLMLLGTLIVTGYRHANSVFRVNPEAGSLRLSLFAAGIIYSFTEAGFRMMSPIWIAFLLAITAVPSALLKEQRQREQESTYSGFAPQSRVRILQ
jgi:O-antigen ligase